jgi:hypothetical protein
MPRLTVRTELKIAATPQAVWDLLLDFESYPRWNPSIRRAQGEVGLGNTVELWTAMLPLGPPVHVRAVVVEVDAPRRLQWLGTLHATWIFTGLHRFILHPQEDDTVLLVQEETFRGALVLVLAPFLRYRITRLFLRTSEAVKRLAERTRRIQPEPLAVG